MDWICCCRTTESEDVSKDTECFLPESDTAEPSGGFVSAAGSDSSRSALDKLSKTVSSARSSSYGSLHESRPPDLSPPTPTGGLAVSPCVVDGHSPSSPPPPPPPAGPSPFFSSVTDAPSVSVPHISTDPIVGSSDPSPFRSFSSPASGFSDLFVFKASPSSSVSAFDPIPSHPTGTVVSTPADIPPILSHTEPLESGHSVPPSCPTPISLTSHTTGSCSFSSALDFHSPTTSIISALTPSVNAEVKSPSLGKPDLNSSLPISTGSSSSSSPPVVAPSASPTHTSLAQRSLPRLPDPALPMPGAAKPSTSAAPQSGLLQSFAQTPVSPVCNPCARASCLYNKPGRLCTIFDQRYVYIGHRDTFILVELKRRISCGLTLGTRLVWKKGKPHLLSDLADGAKVVCDALSLPDTHGFHALIVWQGTKPNFIMEPVEEAEVMMLQRHDLRVTGIEPSEVGGGSIDVDIKGKSVKVKFIEEVVFADGQRSNTNDIFMSFSKFTCSVFATLHETLRGGSGETLSYICSCVWTGTRPAANLLDKVEQGDVFNKNENGTYVKCSASQSIYCDLPAVLKTSEQGKEIVFRSEDEVRHLPIRNEDIFYESESKVSPLPSEIAVLAHISRLKGANRTCVLKVIGVHLPSERSVISFKSKESKKALDSVSGTKEISRQSESEVNHFVDHEKNETQKREKKQTEHDQKEEKTHLENDQHKGKLQPEKEVDFIHVKESILQNKTPVTEEKHKGKDICVEDCIWHYGSISQGIAKTPQKSVLITYDVLYVNGQRISATDTVAKYSKKGSTVSVATVPLVSPSQVLGVTVTHKALAAWHGAKPECVEEIIKAYASGSHVQPGTRVIPETKIERSVTCDRGTNSAPSLHQDHAASEKLSKSSCVEYIAGYRWKIAGISQALIYRNSRVVRVKHEVFFVDKNRIPNTDPISKFVDEERVVNALVVPVSSPQVISGQNVTHEALVAWCGKKPNEADDYVAKYSMERSKLSDASGTHVKTSSLQEIRTTTALLNPRDTKALSTEKMNVPGKDETKGSVKATTANNLPNKKLTTKNGKPGPTSANKKVPDNQTQKKAPPRHAQGKLQRVVGDHGILEVRSKDAEGTKAMVAFHRSVTFLHQQRVDQRKGLEEQLSPHQSVDFFCYIENHDMNKGGVTCQYKATLVWVGKKPKTDTNRDAEAHVNKSQNTKKNNIDPGVLRLHNAAGTLAHASGQAAVLKVRNAALDGGMALVFVHTSDVYVNQRRIESASEMSRHHLWQCNIRTWKTPGTPVEGFVCHYKAELAWVGKMPRKNAGRSSADNSQKEPEKAKKSIARPLLPTPGPPADPKCPDDPHKCEGPEGSAKSDPKERTAILCLRPLHGCLRPAGESTESKRHAATSQMELRPEEVRAAEPLRRRLRAGV
ncbi:uncharacterized protein LOC125024800 [Penaeus chinensis]|uniref:uncharacterized protein LOC125024800 n=1 Tax=Penaeus chinensis TaxID=139456 RepID=UPI001FB6B145|nr:uncharacterized protein LOC125024800 [Penaeus chinensis]